MFSETRTAPVLQHQDAADRIPANYPHNTLQTPLARVRYLTSPFWGEGRRGSYYDSMYTHTGRKTHPTSPATAVG